MLAFISTTYLDEALDSNLPAEVPGAAVAILTEEGEWFGASGFADLENQVPLQPGDRFEAGSITKTFVATTILQLVFQGKLTLEDTLTQWLPTEITDLVPNAGEITVEQILNHTSGISDFSDVLFNQALINPTVFLNEWTPEQLVGLVDGLAPYFAPGTDWRYSNTNYILAGEVIEAVTGNGYGQEIRDRIINPLGLENTFVFGEEEIPGGYINSYWDFDNNGSLDNVSIADLSWAGAAGSIISNSEDLADFFDGLLVDGALLQPETLDQMLDVIPVNTANYDGYGLGIGTLESRNRFWYVHRGQTLGSRSNLWYSPLEEITYVELLNGRSDSNLVSDLLPTYRRTIQPPTPDIVTYEFDWTGQIAEFRVEGEFSYDASQTPLDGIVREENLKSFDVSFFGPDGAFLRTYEDNHLTFPEFNFAFDTSSKQILTDGIFTESDGFNVGEKTAVGDGFTGLHFWSKSKETSPSLIHFDDWSDEFGYEPIGYSTHEDIAFLTRTTAELIETGKVGETYLDEIQDTLTELGNPIAVAPPANADGTFAVTEGTTSLFLDFSLFEAAGLTIQDATPTADAFSNQFQLGFAIDADSTDFSFEAVPNLTANGTLNHTGDITFLVGNDALLTLGDFAIAFDENRVSDSTSGFFVADNLNDGLGIDVLFDVSVPDRFLISDDSLTIADADLLLASELANILGLADLAGTDIGDTRLDAALMEEARLGERPTVSVSTPTPVVSEDGDTTLTVTFTVDGDIPEGGLPITVGGDLTRLFDPELRLLVEAPFVVEPETGLIPVANRDPEFEIALTAPEVSVSFKLFDDILEEEPLALDFKLFEGDGYLVDGDGIATVTLVDGDSVIPGSGPTVSLSVDNADLTEGDDLTVNFEVDGEIPDGGLTVFVDGPPEALSEYDIFGDRGIDPATDLVGIEGFPAADNDAGGFFVNLVENQASITLSVFDDGPTEGPESFTFELIDGENYEVSSIVSRDFRWTGQIAGFSVEGDFSYDAGQSYEAGIVREQDLLSFNVSFFDPDGNLLRTYEDNQDLSQYPTFNFAFDTATQQILQDGTWDVDDDVDLSRNGFMFGEGSPALRGETGSQSGLAFWTRPSDDKLPHLHVDDWSDDLGFPIGYSSHEDVSFPTLTTAQLIDNGKVGETYLESIQDSLAEQGAPVVVSVSDEGSGGVINLTINDGGEAAIFEVKSGVTSVFLDLPLLESAAGLTLVGTDSDAMAISESFQVGFAITDETDFRFAPAPFEPVSGSMEHDGSLTLGLGDAEVTVGEFSIGFDAARVSDVASGFFVADTLDDALGLEVLFDLSAPGTAAISNDELEISAADLLLAPEVATALGLPNLAGADVGDAQIDAIAQLFAAPPVITPPADPLNLFGTNSDDSLTGDSGNDNLYGNEGQNTLIAMGGNDQLFGGNQSDIAFGGEGDDTLYGNEGRDILSGDAGNDIIFAGGGDDVLMGVTGDDVLYGNHGSDLFVFGNGDGTDTIMDFRTGEDMIGLVEGELVFSDLSILQNGLDTTLGVASSGETLAVLKFTQASMLSEDSFSIVPDVSEPAQAMALV